MAATLVEAFSRFSKLFQDPILLVSTSGHVCAANPSARATLFPEAKFVSDTLLAQFTAEPEDQLLEYLRLCSRTAEPLPGTLTFRSAAGPGRKYRCLGSAFRARDDDHNSLVVLKFISHASSTSRFVSLNQQLQQQRAEIARRIRAEQSAHEQRELLQVTLASIGDAVISTDIHGRITFMNAVAAHHTGWTPQEALGRPLDEVFVIRNEITGDAVENPVVKVLQDGQVVGLANHTVLIRRDGTELPIDDSGAPIRDSSGRLFGVILVFHEISEARRLERELMRKTDALQEADRRKDEFLAVLAHELRNPLAPLRNGLQIARLKMGNDETLRRTIDMMDRQVVHLVRLVSDLMDVSRVTRGVIDLRRAPVLIRDVLARSVETVSADLEARGHELSVEVEDGAMLVQGDADRLTQIVSNLLANSSKYSVDRGVIRLRAYRDSQHAVIEVADSGIGIPPDHLERVFDMFSQVRLHQGRAEGGLGIGLALVRTLVQMHGGTVHAFSAGPNTGSTFTVRLPILSSALANTDHPAFVPSGTERARLKILVVDDNTDSASSLQALLSIAGHDVQTANGGRDALRKVEDFRPSLVFMDIGMPEMDGLEATRRIRQLDGGRDIYIVALTGWGQRKDRQRSRDAGVDRHLVKPISPEELEEVLSAALVKMAASGDQR